VLAVDLPWVGGINRPTRKSRIPAVLTQAEVAGVLAQMEEGVTPFRPNCSVAPACG